MSRSAVLQYVSGSAGRQISLNRFGAIQFQQFSEQVKAGVEVGVIAIDRCRLCVELRDLKLTFFEIKIADFCLLYTSPSPRDQRGSRMPSSA